MGALQIFNNNVIVTLIVNCDVNWNEKVHIN